MGMREYRYLMRKRVGREKYNKMRKMGNREGVIETSKRQRDEDKGGTKDKERGRVDDRRANRGMGVGKKWSDALLTPSYNSKV